MVTLVQFDTFQLILDFEGLAGNKLPCIIICVIINWSLIPSCNFIINKGINQFIAYNSSNSSVVIRSICFLTSPKSLIASFNWSGSSVSMWRWYSKSFNIFRWQLGPHNWWIRVWCGFVIIAAAVARINNCKTGSTLLRLFSKFVYWASVLTGKKAKASVKRFAVAAVFRHWRSDVCTRC